MINLDGVDPEIIMLLNMLTKALDEIAQGSPNPRAVAYDAMVCGNILLNGIEEAL